MRRLVSSGRADGVRVGGQGGGDLHYASSEQTWGAAPTAPRSDATDITTTNLATASIDVKRADVDCMIKLNTTTDGPITITLPGCNRVTHAG